MPEYGNCTNGYKRDWDGCKIDSACLTECNELWQQIAGFLVCEIEAEQFLQLAPSRLAFERPIRALLCLLPNDASSGHFCSLR